VPPSARWYLDRAFLAIPGAGRRHGDTAKGRCGERAQPNRARARARRFGMEWPTTDPVTMSISPTCKRWRPLRRFHSSTRTSTSTKESSANGPVGETANESPRPVGRETRRAEDVANCYNCSAPVLSRSVDVPPRRVWRGWRTILSWAMQPARMAQIRRDPASEVVSVSPRRDLRPTGSWVPFRPRAHSPFRCIAQPPANPTFLRP
jgi:hypothetical protein